MRSFKLFTLSTLFFLATCSKKADKNEVILSYTQTIKSLDPQIVESKDVARMLSLTYERVLTYDRSSQDYTFTPQLAASMPKFSKNGKLLTIELKKGVKFTDHPSFPEGKGRELVATDLLYSILRLADPKLASPNFWLLDNKIVGLNEWRQVQKNQAETNYEEIPSGIKIVNSHTLEISLKVEVPQILHSFTHVALSVVAKETVDKLKQDFSSFPVGSGPYRFMRWRKNEFVEFSKDPGYWAAGENMAQIKNIKFKYFKDNTEAFLEFKKGNVDVAKVPPQEFRDVLDLETRGLKDHHKNKGWSFYELSSLNTSFIIFNLSNSKIKSAGVKFRQALSLSLDRAKLNQATTQGGAYQSTGPVPPQVFGFDPSFKNSFIEFDREKAKKLLKSSGWKEGQALELTVYDGADNFAKYIVEGLTAIGVKVDLNKQSLSSFMGALQGRKFQVSFMTWEADYPDAENFHQLLYGPNKAPSPNFANFQNKSFDSKFKKMRTLSDSAQKKKLVADLNKIFLKDLPWAPVFHDASFYVASKRLANFQFKHLLGDSAIKWASLSDERQ